MKKGKGAADNLPLCYGPGIFLSRPLVGVMMTKSSANIRQGSVKSKENCNFVHIFFNISPEIELHAAN
jgi:hypothetical protein